MRFWKLSLLTATLFFAITVSAQINLGSILNSANNLTLRTMPELPRANESVTALLEGYSYNLNQTELSWFLNGKLVKKGIGATNFTFKTGNTESVSTIVVSGVTLTGETFQKVLSIRPAEVDLIWESVGYTPPFYRGKTLYALQGYLRFSAITNLKDATGRKLPDSELNFTWKQDGTVVPNASGVNKNIFNIKDLSGLIKPADVEVLVSAIDNSIAATSHLIVNPIQPLAIFYENNPAYGILYNQALSGSWQLKGEEAVISLVPYFFSAKTKSNKNLSYKWSLNGESADTAGAPGELTVRNDSGLSGNALLSAEVSSATDIFQGANADLTISFGDQNN